MKKIFGLLGLFFVTCGAFANTIELTVHHAPGGPSDSITRFIAKDLPANYIVQNRPGGQGRIAMKQVLKGDSVITATMPQIYVTNPLNFKDLEYNPATDLEILATVATMPNLLGCKSVLGFKTLNDLIKYNGKPLSFAVNGYGSAEHIATESLMAKLKIKHIIVPYAGGGNRGTLDVIAGNVDCSFANLSAMKPFAGDPRVDILLSSHDMGIKGVPTWDKQFKESYPYQSYICLVVAKTMDDATKKKIVSDLNKVFANPSFKESVYNLGLLPIGTTEEWMANSVLKSNRMLEHFINNNKLNVGQ
jgi:tripartite-type tricarboxylate transporter receptor subunit TctC